MCFGHGYDEYGGMEETDARRIVACVNACEGVSTEDLEKMVGKQIYEALYGLSII